MHIISILLKIIVIKALNKKTESECWEGGGGKGKEGSELKIELWWLFVSELRCGLLLNQRK